MTTPTDAVLLRAREKLELWFFRECNAGTRRHLFSIFGYPVEEITCDSHERLVLRNILAALQDRAGVGDGPHRYANLGELEREDTAVFKMLDALHANVPELDRPKSWSDLSTEQAERARQAVRAVFAFSASPASPDAVGIRRAALEEAAAIADRYREVSIIAGDIAAAIRGLAAEEG